MRVGSRIAIALPSLSANQLFCPPATHSGDSFSHTLILRKMLVTRNERDSPRRLKMLLQVSRSRRGRSS